MDGQTKAPVELAIAHVLFIDIVGYSKLTTREQNAAIATLNEIVQNSEPFQIAEKANRLLKIPTGDGMAVVFYRSPEEPVECAVALARALKQHPHLKVRMGVHSGSVSGVVDVNGRANVAGAGINIAQRVMDGGDGGHILLSRHAADDLGEYEHWRPLLHDLGELEVKHGVKVSVVNFFDGDVGNPAIPEKIHRLRKTQAAGARRRTIVWSLGTIAAMTAVGAAFWIQSRRAGLAIPSGGELQKSVAVLPLENLSPEKENAFFADGIQDDILTSLAKISDLKVISRASVMQYRGAGVTRNLRDIAQALGVGNILEGTVRRVGNRALINVQLINPRDGRQIWAERYDRTIADSIGLQGELATEIAAALKAKLAPEEKARLAAKPTTNPEAYLFYLRALERARTAASKEDAFAIDDLYAKAIELDPAFAVAIARRSMWNSLMYTVGRRPQNKAASLALAAQALQLSPDLPEAHVALGLGFYWIEKNYPAALREFSTASAASALEPDVLDYTAEIYCRQGRWREGLAAYDRLQEIDPRHVHEGGPSTRASLRDWRAAIAGYERLLAMEPKNIDITLSLARLTIEPAGDFAAARKLVAGIPPGLHGAPGQPSMIDVSITQTTWEIDMLARDYAAAEKVLADYKGDEFIEPLVGLKTVDAARLALAHGDAVSARLLFEKVRPIYEAGVRDHPDFERSHARLGRLYAYLGRKDDAVRESVRAIELCPESKDALEGPNYAVSLAFVYARTGEIDQAITVIKRLLTTPNGISLTDLRLNWDWDSLRSNPRFQKILAEPEPKTVY